MDTTKAEKQILKFNEKKNKKVRREQTKLIQ